jgi:hypothetical protein
VARPSQPDALPASRGNILPAAGQGQHRPVEALDNDGQDNDGQDNDGQDNPGWHNDAGAILVLE